MALADLIARLEEEAHSRVQAIEDDADRDVRALETATDRAVRESTEEHLACGRAARHAVQSRELAAATRRARARALDARRAQIARILDRARDLASAATPSGPYGRALPSDLEEALSFLRGLRPRVRCHPAFAPLVESAIAAHPGAELVLDESMGPGIVAEAADGSVVVDGTLAAGLARAEPLLAIELSRRLDDECH